LWILLVNKFFYRKGGVDVSFFETAKLLESKGHKILFFSMKHPKNFPSSYEKYFVSNVDYNRSESILVKVKSAGRVLYSLEAKKKIEKLIKEQKPDIVHLNSIYHQISPSILHVFKKWNLPVVMALHDYKMVCPTYLMLRRGKICEKCKRGRYYWCLINRCTKNSYLKSALNVLEMYLHHRILHIYDLVDVFISPSIFLKEKMKEMGFEKKIFYLPHFINAEAYQQEYYFNEKTICYFGRLSQEKGLSLLIDAIRRLNVLLKIIGDGPEKKNLEEKVRKENIKNVNFLGYKSQKELKEEIQKSLFVVLPSQSYETFGLTIIESFALGKPVIGSKIGAIPELVKDGRTGLTFEPRNAENLRDKIKYLINNREKISEMGKNAKKFVEKELNSERYYNQLMEIYQLAMRAHK